MSISIGPVQDFIVAARRTRDLWYGSWLVSELSKVAIRTVLENGGQLISPAIQTGEELAENYLSVNRILAIVEQPTTIGDALQGKDDKPGALEAFLLQQWAEVCRRITHVKNNEPIQPEIWRWLDPQTKPEAQIRDLIECQWVAVLFIESEYKRCRDQVEALLAARKNTRNFQPVSWGRYSPKSSLDGVRESVIKEELYAESRESQTNREKKTKTLYDRLRAGPAERLSAVDLLKRLGNETHFDRIPSTSHIASRPFVESLNQYADVVKPLVAALRRELENLIDIDIVQDTTFASAALGNLDSSFLYENRLQAQAEEQGLSVNRIDGAKQMLQQFYRDLKGIDRKLGEPSPYYALLLADGDNMGKTIDHQIKVEDQQALAKALDDFAQGTKKDDGVRYIVEKKYKGALIYAGGDDVMAFLPLHTVFACAKELAETFQSTLNKFKFIDDKTGETLAPTLSCGITIAHHIEPLADVLRLTRDAEREAKRLPGKNAIAITLSKRSGVDRTIVGGWGSNFLARMSDFISLFEKDLLTHGVAHELASLYQRLHIPKHWNEKSETNNTLQEAMQQEALRILEHKMGRGGEKKLTTDIRNKMRGYIREVNDVQMLAHELIVAETLASASRTARSQPVQPKGEAV